jgi:hypothetical protein
MLDALLHKFPTAIQTLLQHGVEDVRCRALFYAARNGQLEAVLQLLNRGLPEQPEEASALQEDRLKLALCGAASTGQIEVVKGIIGEPSPPSSPYVPEHSPPPASPPPPLQQQQPVTGAANAARDAGRVSSDDGRTESSDDDEEFTPAAITLRAAMQAAIAPNSYIRQCQLYTWFDSCKREPDNDVPRDYPAVVRLLLSHGVDPAAEGGRLLELAIGHQQEDHSHQVLDVLLTAPTVQTASMTRQAMLAALYYENTRAISQLLPRVKEDQALYSCAQQG